MVLHDVPFRAAVTAGPSCRVSGLGMHERFRKLSSCLHEDFRKSGERGASSGQRLVTMWGAQPPPQ